MRQKIIDLNLPRLVSRDEMLSIMLEQVYGQMPEKPSDIRFDVSRNVIPNFCAGKAVCNKITAVCTVNGKTFSFPFYSVIPTDDKKHLISTTESDAFIVIA